jgi:hypothetical protein
LAFFLVSLRFRLALFFLGCARCFLLFLIASLGSEVLLFPPGLGPAQVFKFPTAACGITPVLPQGYLHPVGVLVVLFVLLFAAFLGEEIRAGFVEPQLAALVLV